MKGSQVCSNEWLSPFPKGDILENYEIAKRRRRNIKIFFSRTTGPISTKHSTMHSWLKGIQVCSNEGQCTLFSKEKFWQNSKFQQNLLNFISKPQDHFDGREYKVPFHSPILKREVIFSKFFFFNQPTQWYNCCFP